MTHLSRRRLNIADPAFAYDGDDPEGFRAGMLRIGPLIGGALFGISVYELPPGQAICPYHYEYGDEEWLIVLQGRPTLRHPEGEDELEPWDVICFPEGPEGAHAVRNRTPDTVRVLMASTKSKTAASVYPDSNKIGIWTGNKADDVMVRRSDAVGYWVDEPKGSETT